MRRRFNRSVTQRPVTPPSKQNYESSGPGNIRLKGLPFKLAERYEKLAEESQNGSDRVYIETLRQHAEHYNRLARGDLDAPEKDGHHESMKGERYAEEQPTETVSRFDGGARYDARDASPHVARNRREMMPPETHQASQADAHEPSSEYHDAEVSVAPRAPRTERRLQHGNPLRDPLTTESRAGNLTNDPRPSRQTRRHALKPIRGQSMTMGEASATSRISSPAGPLQNQSRGAPALTTGSSRSTVVAPTSSSPRPAQEGGDFDPPRSSAAPAVVTQSVATQSVATEPATSPAATQPVVTEPATPTVANQPTATKPATPPVASQSVATKPATPPVASQSVATKPATQPTATEPATQSVATPTVATPPAATQPTAPQPNTDAPVDAPLRRDPFAPTEPHGQAPIGKFTRRRNPRKFQTPDSMPQGQQSFENQGATSPGFIPRRTRFRPRPVIGTPVIHAPDSSTQPRGGAVPPRDNDSSSD
ncbi:MAG: DUF4167 domain-containing protein [Alphaproteobacteria bacterium]|nr:DUF4167 domain-containing protein [Alphaproteobacteria bacterium]